MKQMKSLSNLIVIKSINGLDKIRPITVGHIPREISRDIFYFLQEGGSVTGSVADIYHPVSPIPEGVLESPILI